MNREIVDAISSNRNSGPIDHIDRSRKDGLVGACALDVTGLLAAVAYTFRRSLLRAVS